MRHGGDGVKAVSWLRDIDQGLVYDRGETTSRKFLFVLLHSEINLAIPSVLSWWQICLRLRPLTPLRC